MIFLLLSVVPVFAFGGQKEGKGCMILMLGGTGSGRQGRIRNEQRRVKYVYGGWNAGANGGGLEIGSAAVAITTSLSSKTCPRESLNSEKTVPKEGFAGSLGLSFPLFASWK